MFTQEPWESWLRPLAPRMVVSDRCQELGSSGGMQTMLQHAQGEHEAAQIRIAHCACHPPKRHYGMELGKGDAVSRRADPVQQTGSFLVKFRMRWRAVVGLSGTYHLSWCFKGGL